MPYPLQSDNSYNWPGDQLAWRSTCAAFSSSPDKSDVPKLQATMLLQPALKF